MRKAVLLITAFAILCVVNYGIWHRERIISGGRPLILELAPVDPRSLMQGDYMALRYRLAANLVPHIKDRKEGVVVVVTNFNNIGYGLRWPGPGLANFEMLLRYQVRRGEPSFASNAFFFQEGEDKMYRSARYAELRVAPDGEAILVRLLDRDRRELVPQPKPELPPQQPNRGSSRGFFDRW
jgi:uncharacterized membrane-anchored protein